MVVDDERVNRTLLSALLKRRYGFAPREFAHGAELMEALRALRGRPAEEWPAFVTLDVEMPVMDGRMTLAAIRTEAESLAAAGDAESSALLLALPVLVVTANARSRDRAQLLRLGARVVLNKPIDPEALLAAAVTDWGARPRDAQA